MKLYINEEITENFANAFIAKIPESGNLSIHINSVGGEVDAALRIYDAIVSRETTTFADGNVFSAAIIPFLAGKKRIFTQNAKFLIHPATFNRVDNISLNDIAGLQNELKEYTDIIADIYADNNVSRETISALYGNEDLIIDDFDNAKRVGIVTDYKKTVENRLSKTMNILRSKKPIQKYKFESKKLKQILNFYNMEKKETAQLLQAIAQLTKKVSNMEKNNETVVRKVLNELITEVENSTAVTPEVAAILAPKMKIAEAKVAETSSEIKIVYFGETISGGVALLGSDNQPTTLDNGTYSLTVGKITLSLKVDNSNAQIINEVEEDIVNEQEESEIVEDNEDETEDEDKAAFAPESKIENKKSNAPIVNNTKVPTNNENKRNLLNVLYKIVGAGGVGSKK